MAWTGFQLDVPSLQFRLAGNDEIYEYKLPYNVPSAPWCTRIHPSLYCCDRMCCCCCLPNNVGQLPFVDVVDQETGHQLRYRAKKACCRVPRVVAFADGKNIGHLSRTMRCCNACYTCLEDYNSQPVLQVALHDADGNQLARIDRDGRGRCCEANCKAPMKCNGCCLTCLTCTCACRPSAPAMCGNLHTCDPVCCDCCVRGHKTACACFDAPCCCIGLPLVLACWCPCPAIETKRLKNTGTAKFRDFDVISVKDNHQVGKVQALYRGNYPSAYTHSTNKVFKITGHSQDTTIGMLLSGIAAGMAYPMGRKEAVFAGLTAKESGTSPDFGGKVEVTYRSQIERLLGMDGKDPALREDLCVGSDLVLGPHLMGVQVKGWRLIEVGFFSAAISMCGVGLLGKSRSSRGVQSIEQVKDMVKVALEGQLGEHGTTFKLRFELPDQEKGVCKKGNNVFGDLNALADGFNPPRQGFIEQLEEVACACNAIRVCRCCNFSSPSDKVVCCRCPLYARPYNNTSVVPSAWEAVPPPKVVMVHAPKDKFMK